MFNRTPTNIEVDVTKDNKDESSRPTELEIEISTKSIANQMHTSKIKMPTKQLELKVESSPEVDDPEDQEQDFGVALQSIKERQDSLRHRKSSYIGSSVDEEASAHNSVGG